MEGEKAVIWLLDKRFRWSYVRAKNVVKPSTWLRS